MMRIVVFITGLAIAALSLPMVLEHHARAEIMQLAWCSSSGQSAPGTNLLAMHCAACPTFVAGVFAMAASPFLNILRRARLLQKARA